MKHSNLKKDSRLRSFPKDSIETSIEQIKGLLSFSFKYLDSTQGQKFSELSSKQFEKLVEKLRWYSNESRYHWESERIGNKTGRVLTVYNEFPRKTEFRHPAHVPADVKWSRFRLEGDMRLIGFVIDKSDVERFNLNPDVFYVVFLDLYHKFYISDR